MLSEYVELAQSAEGEKVRHDIAERGRNPSTILT